MADRTQHSLQNGDTTKAAVIRASVEHATHTALQSWKEIASELNRGVRTVQRWERKLGLPVRRVGKGPRGPVLAFKDELQRWLRDNAKGSAPHDNTLLQSIKDFVHAKQSATVEQSCNQCGSPMKFLNGNIWIYGTSNKWKLAVPFCPVCDPDVLEPFCRSNIILQ
jgi:hypothetical protein